MPAFPSPVPAAKPHDWFKGGHNIREIVIDESIRELARSEAAHGFLQPVGAVDHGDHGEMLYGFRRLAAYRWGLSEKLALPATIPVVLYPATLTTTQRRIVTATENLQRQDLRDPEIYRLCKELMELNPEWARKDLAVHLNKHPSAVTQYFSPDDLIPEAKQAFLDGKFGFGIAYAIVKSPDQAAAFDLHRNGGATREELDRRRRRNGDGKAATVKSQSIAVVLNSGIVVQFKGKDITLDMALDSVSDLKRELDGAKKDGHDAKTLGALMKKRAARAAGSRANAAT